MSMPLASVPLHIDLPAERSHHVQCPLLDYDLEAASRATQHFYIDGAASDAFILSPPGTAQWRVLRRALITLRPVTALLPGKNLPE